MAGTQQEDLTSAFKNLDTQQSALLAIQPSQDALEDFLGKTIQYLQSFYHCYCLNGTHVEAVGPFFETFFHPDSGLFKTNVQSTYAALRKGFEEYLKEETDPILILRAIYTNLKSFVNSPEFPQPSTIGSVAAAFSAVLPNTEGWSWFKKSLLRRLTDTLLPRLELWHQALAVPLDAPLFPQKSLHMLWMAHHSVAQVKRDSQARITALEQQLAEQAKAHQVALNEVEVHHQKIEAQLRQEFQSLQEKLINTTRVLQAELPKLISAMNAVLPESERMNPHTTTSDWLVAKIQQLGNKKSEKSGLRFTP